MSFRRLIKFKFGDNSQKQTNARAVCVGSFLASAACDSAAADTHKHAQFRCAIAALSEVVLLRVRFREERLKERALVCV